jgi:hypothetical protein
MIRTRSIGLTLFMTIVLSSPAFAQVFFRMDYTVGAAPNGGWPEVATSGTTHTRSRVAGGGPQGEDTYELTQLYTGSRVTGWGGEYYWGWKGTLESQDPSQGSRRFYRWRMRFSPTTNFKGVYSTDGGATTLTNKILMIGDGCGRNRCRVIVSYRGADNQRQIQFLRIQLDGGEDNADTPPINVGEWVNVQIEVDSSTSTSSADGAYKIWINNNDYSRPTAQRTNIQLNPVLWRYVFLGAYNNNGLQPDGVHSWRQTGFEAATTFDAAWHRGGTMPSAPANLRIIRP